MISVTTLYKSTTLNRVKVFYKLFKWQWKDGIDGLQGNKLSAVFFIKILQAKFDEHKYRLYFFLNMFSFSSLSLVCQAVSYLVRCCSGLDLFISGSSEPYQPLSLLSKTWGGGKI